MFNRKKQIAASFAELVSSDFFVTWHPHEVRILKVVDNAEVLYLAVGYCDLLQNWVKHISQLRKLVQIK